MSALCALAGAPLYDHLWREHRFLYYMRRVRSSSSWPRRFPSSPVSAPPSLSRRSSGPVSRPSAAQHLLEIRSAWHQQRRAAASIAFEGDSSWAVRAVHARRNEPRGVAAVPRKPRGYEFPILNPQPRPTSGRHQKMPQRRPENPSHSQAPQSSAPRFSSKRRLGTRPTRRCTPYTPYFPVPTSCSNAS
jgi:hypothetical protein